MKAIKLKIMIFTALLALCSSVRGQNFDQAIGGRFGTDFMLTYKEFFMYYPKPQLAYEIMGGLQFDERVLGKRSIPAFPDLQDLGLLWEFTLRKEKKSGLEVDLLQQWVYPFHSGTSHLTFQSIGCPYSVVQEPVLHEVV